MRPPPTKITSTILSKTGAIIKSSPTEISLGSELFAGAFYQAFWEVLTPILLKLLFLVGKECPLPKCFYNVSII